MKRIWQLQEAKSKFSELVDCARAQGPQLVTKRGLHSVVVLSVEDFTKLSKPKEPLIAFFKKAPKVSLDIKRPKDMGRHIQL
jgi:antitoxin Phd